MMKLLYVLPVKEDRSVSPSFGVYKKVLAQLKGFESNGIETELYEGLIISKYLRMLPFNTTSINWEKVPVTDDIDVIYIRYTFFDFQMLRFCKKVRRKYPNVKLIVEIPTYPYDMEYKSLNLKVIRDRLYRKKFCKYVDRIATYSNDEQIFGIRTIKIINGIDLDSVKIRNTSNDILNRINICCVANFAYWHGLDRLLKGLIEYYKINEEMEINIFLVGNQNEETDRLKEIIKGTEAENHVFWKGILLGDRLDEVYDYSSIGVESLGSFRKGISVSSSLKSREYLAKGLPIIYSGKIDIVPNDFEYSLSFPEEESIIPIEEIVKFYERLYFYDKGANVAQKIRLFAENNISIIRTVEPITEYIKNG